jgi:hypothetical protein
MVKTRLLLCAIAVLALAAYDKVPAKADSLGLDFASTPPANFGPSTWNLGWSFTVVNSVTVVGLGNADILQNGFSPPGSDQQVGLWDSSGNLLASVQVTPTDPLDGANGGFWRFASIAPITLTAGQTYVVGGQGGAFYSGIVPVTVNPNITFGHDLYTFNGGANSPLVEPLKTEGYDSPGAASWFGGNVEFASVSPVPEPVGVASLLGLGGMGLVGLAWRRRRS